MSNEVKNWNGLILVDKPSGVTSHDVVARLRRVFKTKAVGHTGTLDPLASGLMVCLLNEATKLSQYILEGDKGYHLSGRLGIKTDTLDITGQVIEHNEVRLRPDLIQGAAQRLTGTFEWQVPIYSAIKVQGQKLYEYARQGEEVAIPTKEMRFWSLEQGKSDGTDFEFSIKCSKGSYIRSWIEKLGHELQVPATMTGLRRFYSAPYYLDKAIPLATLEEKGAFAAGEAFIPMERALPDTKVVRVKGHDENLLKNGQISYDLKTRLIVEFQPGVDTYLQVHSLDSGKLLALVGVDQNKGLVIKRGFQY